MALNIKNGKEKRAQKVVIYGSEGIGKTTLAAQFPNPLFIDLENGSSNYDVARINNITDYTDFVATLTEVYAEKDLCKTIVIDTADKLESYVMKAVCEDKKVDGIEDIGYGKGYQYLAEKFAGCLSVFDCFIKKGINVVVVAHAQMRKFEQPDEKGAYDRWELKLSKKCAPMLKEWADLLLFCNYKTVIFEGKPKGGDRVMYSDHRPCWDAKNRFGLPSEMPMDYKQLADIFEEPKEIKKTTAKEKK